MEKNINIIRANIDYLTICSDILKDSELGMKYFINANGEYIGKELLKEGFDNNEIYVSVTEDGSSLGFSWIQERGIFHWFPFLHVVAVDKEHRGNGYGTLHLKHFEKMCVTEFEAHKSFLMVGDYNEKAIELYKHLGYKQVGNIPDLFVKGINEILMYK